MKYSTAGIRRLFVSKAAALAGILAVTLTCQTAEAAIVTYYIGVDGRTTVPSGIYAGLPNPNFNRLTFLYAHTMSDPVNNHYHPKGTIVYTGDNNGASTATMVSTLNFLPEAPTPPLLLQAGSGAYLGKLVNIPVPGNRFSFLEIQNTHKLADFAPGSPEAFMFNSTGGRWNGSIAGSDVHMKLVSATAGLFFGTATDPNSNPFAGPEGLHLADSFSFNLHPWVDASAAPGVYTAQFMLEDEEGIFGDSGTFEFRFQVIPEPSTALLSVLAVGGFVLRRRRA